MTWHQSTLHCRQVSRHVIWHLTFWRKRGCVEKKIPKMGQTWTRSKLRSHWSSKERLRSGENSDLWYQAGKKSWISFFRLDMSFDIWHFWRKRGCVKKKIPQMGRNGYVTADVTNRHLADVTNVRQMSRHDMTSEFITLQANVTWECLGILAGAKCTGASCRGWN